MLFHRITLSFFHSLIHTWHGNELWTYFSSPPTLSFWWVELGPQVRPFFLLVDRSSFLHTALRPHVLLPSIGVTEGQQEVLTLTSCHGGVGTLCSFQALALTSNCPQSGNDPGAGRRGGALAPLRLPLVHAGRRLDRDLMLEAFGCVEERNFISFFFICINSNVGNTHRRKGRLEWGFNGNQCARCELQWQQFTSCQPSTTSP